MSSEACSHAENRYGEPAVRFSLIKTYAQGMNLRLHASISDEKLLLIRVSNIKLV